VATIDHGSGLGAEPLKGFIRRLEASGLARADFLFALTNVGLQLVAGKDLEGCPDLVLGDAFLDGLSYEPHHVFEGLLVDFQDGLGHVMFALAG